jgi:bile acid:Na+ symporter, BASS family
MHWLLPIAKMSMLVFMVSNMLAFGMRLSPREVIEPLRDKKLTLKAFLGNLVIVPLAAYLLTRLFHLSPAYSMALILLATSGGDPGVTKASQIAKGDPAYTLATMIGLQIVTVFYMPIMLPRLLGGVTVDPLKIASPLITFLLLPLFVGFGIRARWSKLAGAWWEPLDKVSSVILALAITLFVVLNLKQILGAYGSHLLVACLAFIAISFVTGFLLGGPRKIRRSDLALQTLIRGISAAMVVALTNFPNDMDLISGIIVCAVAMILSAIIVAAWLRIRNTKERAETVPQEARQAV